MTPIYAKNEEKITAFAITIGIILYLSKFLRPYFSDNNSALFILGFLPNLGLSFALPFIYAANRYRLNKPVKNFTISCVATVSLMILNEIRDKYQSGRVFDWYDILASVLGVMLAFLVYHLMLKVNP